MRYFNTHGPVEADKHYMVARQALADRLTEQIEQGKYFTIFAPRQMGKTTLLRQLEALLQTRPTIIPIPLSFERFESWPVSEFWDEVGLLINYHIRERVRQLNPPQLLEIEGLLTTQLPNSNRAFEHFFRALYQISPEVQVVLIIDEFDATPQEALSPLLQTWRTMYLEKRPPHSLHSVVLIGIQNIAQLNFGRSSPFNIAYQHRLEGFTSTEVRELLDQYTAETGQPFAADLIEQMYEQTGGQPFLLNRLAAILTEDIVTKRNRPLDRNDLRLALRQFIRESNYNFETLLRQANPYQDDLLKILFGGEYEFNLNIPMVQTLFMHGILSATATGNCQIANPIYMAVLLAAFRPVQARLQADILVNGYDFQPHMSGEALQMDALLSRFRHFVERRGQEAFKVTPMPQEATGQYLLMAYLELLIRHAGGDLFTEVDSGPGRLDLLIVRQGRRYIVETKIWRGPAAFREGIQQLLDYLATENEPIGYYVVFHARPTVYGELPQELEFRIEEAGKLIYVYLVRLAL